MKKLLILLIPILLIQCKPKAEGETVQPIEKSIEQEVVINACSPNYILVDEFKNIETVLEEGGGRINYHFRLFPNAVPMTPCNLPKEYEKAGLKVKISGKVYDIPGTNVLYVPIEITQLTVLE